MSIFTKGPSIEYNKAPKGDVDVVSSPRLALHENTLYLLYNGFYALDQSSNDWKPVEIPFQVGTGMSIISTPKGLVVYGGEISGTRLKEMWILSDGKWRPIPANLKCRTGHACTWVPTYNGLLIHGGCDDVTLSDFQIIDLDSGNIHEIRTNMNLELSYHTITYISSYKIAIFGGLDKDKFLNNTLYEMNLNSGKIVRVKVDSDLADTNAGRCSHQAFEFFGCLCVTGGFRLGEKVLDVSIFDFQHGVWLTLDLSSYFRDPWLVVPLSVGYWLLNSSCMKARMLYYNQNKQPFVDINDDHLLNFFSQLMTMNTASQKLKKLEQKNVDLLNEVESERRKLAEMVVRLDPNSMARQVTELISERDQLQQKIMTLEIFHEKQEKRHARKPDVTPRPSKKKDSTPPIEILRQIETLKRDLKSDIAALSEKNASLFTEIEARMHHDKNIASKVLPPTEELAHAVRSINISEMPQQISSTGKEVRELEERLASLNSRNQSIEENLIEATEYLQTVGEQNQGFKLKLSDLMKSYYAGRKDLIMANHRENSTTITVPGRDFQTLKVLQKQGTQYIQDMEKYKMVVPALKDKLVSMLNGILELSEDETGTERIQGCATNLAKLVSDIVAIHNSGAKLIESKNDEIALPQTESSGPAVLDGSPRPANRVRKCTNFSNRTFDLENGIWCDFYNSIISLVDELDEHEKKGFV